MIGQTVSHYKILEKLGGGGMGVVYKAHDAELDRDVALKFLPHYLTSDPTEKERFYNEARAAAALMHQNIAVVYEIGEHDGQLFIAMEYVEGKTLKEVVHGEPLSLHQVLDIAVQVCDGLAAAHEKGIVHRDIKSENIILTPKGQAKVMDFGLAKVKGATKLTKTGSTLGTAAYMSPEQAQGEEVDQRSDIFSFGVVFYEMLTGRLPFRGEHPTALAYSIVNEEPQPVGRFNGKVTPEIEHIVSKALAKDKDERYQHADEVLADLRHERKKLEYAKAGYATVTSAAPTRKWRYLNLTFGMAAGVLLVVLAIVFNPFRQNASQPQTASTEEKSIAVLPFVDMSPQKDQEYFCDGITDELINRLSNVRELKVPARTSVFTFKGKTIDMKDVGAKLNVQAVLEGSVQKSGDQLRIIAQLIDVSNGYHLWSEKYDRELKDIFAIQDDISSAIVDALKLQLTAPEKLNMSKRSVENVVAYQLYLKANAIIWQFTASSLDSALLDLRKALDIEGDNAVLYSALAFAYWQYVNVGAAQEDYLAKAEAYAQKALALDPDSPQAHFVIGMSRVLYGNVREAVRQLKMSLTVNPNYVDALKLLAGLYTMSFGKPAAAIPFIQRFKQIEPLDPWNFFLQGRLYFFNGEYKPALELLRRSYQTDPDNRVVRFFYSWTLTYENDFHEAFTIIDQDARTAPGNVFTKFGLLLKYGLTKDRESAFREMTADFRKTCRRDHQWSYLVAIPLALLGAREEALDWLQNAIDTGFINYPELERNRYLSNLRGEERFKKLMERVKYEWEHFEV